LYNSNQNGKPFMLEMNKAVSRSPLDEVTAAN
jgi:hypothetical protein